MRDVALGVDWDHSCSTVATGTSPPWPPAPSGSPSSTREEDRHRAGDARVDAVPNRGGPSSTTRRFWPGSSPARPTPWPCLGRAPRRQRRSLPAPSTSGPCSEPARGGHLADGDRRRRAEHGPGAGVRGVYRAVIRLERLPCPSLPDRPHLVEHHDSVPASVALLGRRAGTTGRFRRRPGYRPGSCVESTRRHRRTGPVGRWAVPSEVRCPGSTLPE